MPGLSDSSSDSSNSINVKGDRNQSIGQNYGNAFGNVEGNVYLNQQPKFLSLHQLPSDIDFTGRETDIQTIRQLLLNGTSVAISGMPGVGKSALAIHVAQQLAESDFPDVQLYVDLRGADGDGLDPAEVLAGFLRAFGLDESNIPRNLQERSRLYRSQLAGKRSIVLLDNAQDEAQVRPLLPGNGCAVIITSRRVLGALAAESIPLKVLSADEARDLLAKSIRITRLETEPQAAAEILRLCDGLPLAILIAGGTLKSKRHWSLGEYSRKLADERQRLERLQLSDLSVRASFELSYRELSAADGLLFGKLGILVGKDFGEGVFCINPPKGGISRFIYQS
jgi:predicted ATPase